MRQATRARDKMGELDAASEWRQLFRGEGPEWAVTSSSRGAQLGVSGSARAGVVRGWQGNAPFHSRSVSSQNTPNYDDV